MSDLLEPFYGAAAHLLLILILIEMVLLTKKELEVFRLFQRVVEHGRMGRHMWLAFRKMLFAIKVAAVAPMPAHRWTAAIWSF